ncbi:MAG: ATP-binding cassette domain-containing protein [Hyphomonadaceae bacterium]
MSEGGGDAEGPFLFELNELVSGYAGRPVIRTQHLELAPGEVLAMVGRSGAGKSTLLATLSGSLPPISGTVRFQGKEVDTPWLSQNVARTLQSFPLLHWRTVRGNLELAAQIRGAQNIDALAILKRFSADGFADKFPPNISGGQRARASLAQAAVTRPKLLLLDEPLTGLDPIVKRSVAEALFTFAREENAAVMFVTHDLLDALRYCGRVAAVSSAGPVAVISEIVHSDTPDAEARVLSCPPSAPLRQVG